MTVQLALDLAAPNALERFGISHRGTAITYGDVSRHMRKLRYQGKWVELAELVDAAVEQFEAPGWRKVLAEWRAKAQIGAEVGSENPEP